MLHLYFPKFLKSSLWLRISGTNFFKQPPYIHELCLPFRWMQNILKTAEDTACSFIYNLPMLIL